MDVTNPDIINDNEFNKLFDAHFWGLRFNFDKPFDTDKMIDRIEAKKKKTGVKLKYNPSDTSRVRIILPASVNEIVVEPFAINITVPHTTSPVKLVEVYKETQRLLDSVKIKLIEDVK